MKVFSLENFPLYGTASLIAAPSMVWRIHTTWLTIIILKAGEGLRERGTECASKQCMFHIKAYMQTSPPSGELAFQKFYSQKQVVFELAIAYLTIEAYML